MAYVSKEARRKLVSRLKIIKTVSIVSGWLLTVELSRKLPACFVFIKGIVAFILHVQVLLRKVQGLTLQISHGKSPFLC